MEFNKLNINSIKSWVISRAISTIIISGILIGGYYYFAIKLNAFNETVNFYLKIGIAVIIFFMLLNTIVYPSFEYKQWRYLITKDKIEFSEGIYWIKTIVIPIVRIQHIKIKQGPINRKFKLADIQIYTAGGSYTIPNIEMGKAEEISDFLKDKVKEKVIENDK
ncbi:PH domain-containing protein [Clostridium sp. SHJSY1]|uniref:PH domain-containing protein n=1 Tax=Clostridium sp. SHJSY1 TaxID=2942483 RepID=UPI0028753D8E|nr:PH domain-containing protein [Clostridium sp. SHJSY1]MDS0524338.1 PH domain-containing protein [Clostridium sp. SHJSY1]